MDFGIVERIARDLVRGASHDGTKSLPPRHSIAPDYAGLSLTVRTVIEESRAVHVGFGEPVAWTCDRQGLLPIAIHETASPVHVQILLVACDAERGWAWNWERERFEPPCDADAPPRPPR